MYHPLLLDHFQNPRNAGELAPPALCVEVTNPACGDILRLSALMEGDQVIRARFKTRGCTASIAASSALTELITGKTRRELRLLGTHEIERAVGALQPASRHAASLCIDALNALLRIKFS